MRLRHRAGDTCLGRQPCVRISTTTKVYGLGEQATVRWEPCTRRSARWHEPLGNRAAALSTAGIDDLFAEQLTVVVHLVKRPAFCRCHCALSQSVKALTEADVPRGQLVNASTAAKRHRSSRTRLPCPRRRGRARARYRKHCGSEFQPTGARRRSPPPAN